MEYLNQGATIFIIIVAVLLAFVAGLSTTDFLKTKEKEEESDQSQS